MYDLLKRLWQTVLCLLHCHSAFDLFQSTFLNEKIAITSSPFSRRFVRSLQQCSVIQRITQCEDDIQYCTNLPLRLSCNLCCSCDTPRCSFSSTHDNRELSLQHNLICYALKFWRVSNYNNFVREGDPYHMHDFGRKRDWILCTSLLFQYIRVITMLTLYRKSCYPYRTGVKIIFFLACNAEFYCTLVIN